MSLLIAIVIMGAAVAAVAVFALAWWTGRRSRRAAPTTSMADAKGESWSHGNGIGQGPFGPVG